jgi:hypothetical protein
LPVVSGFWRGAVGGHVDDLPAPAGQVGELFTGVHLDPSGVTSRRRGLALGEPFTDFAVAPHATQQGGNHLVKVDQGGGAKQEVGIASGHRVRPLAFERWRGAEPWFRRFRSTSASGDLRTC